MQKGINQTVAWLVAVFGAFTVFSVGAFIISKYEPSEHASEQHMSAKELDNHDKPQKPNHAGHKTKKASEGKSKPKNAKTGGETLRPDDMHH